MHNSVATPQNPLWGIPQKLFQHIQHLLQPKKPHTTRFSLPSRSQTQAGSAEDWGSLLLPGFGKHQELSRATLEQSHLTHSTRNGPWAGAALLSPHSSPAAAALLDQFPASHPCHMEGEAQGIITGSVGPTADPCAHTASGKGLGEKRSDLDKSQTSC